MYIEQHATMLEQLNKLICQCTNQKYAPAALENAQEVDVTAPLVLNKSEVSVVGA